MCGTLGNNIERSFTVASNRKLYLDIGNPAPCAGTITNWRVCYYGPSNRTNLTSYWSTYAVYRRASSNDSYERVSDTFSAVQASGIELLAYDFRGIVDGVVQLNGFTCYDDEVDSPLTVQAGDVIGACIFDPDDTALAGFTITRHQLNIVGRGRGNNNQLMQTMTAQCTRDSLLLSIPTSELESRPRVLHIHATIGIHI